LAIYFCKRVFLERKFNQDHLEGPRQVQGRAEGVSTRKVGADKSLLGIISGAQTGEATKVWCEEKLRQSKGGTKTGTFSRFKISSSLKKVGGAEGFSKKKGPNQKRKKEGEGGRKTQVLRTKEEPVSPEKEREEEEVRAERWGLNFQRMYGKKQAGVFCREKAQGRTPEIRKKYRKGSLLGKKKPNGRE